MYYRMGVQDNEGFRSGVGALSSTHGKGIWRVSRLAGEHSPHVNDWLQVF